MPSGEGARWNSEWEPKDEQRGDNDTYLDQITRLEKELAEAKSKLEEHKSRLYEISIPPSIEGDVEITQILKSKGDIVSAEDILFRVHHKFGGFSIRASVYGEIEEIKCAVGDVINSGATIATVSSAFLQNHQLAPDDKVLAPTAETDLNVPIEDINIYRIHWPRLAEDCLLRQKAIDRVETYRDQNSDAGDFVDSITDNQKKELAKYGFTYLALPQVVKFYEAGFRLKYRLDYWMDLRSEGIVNENDISDKELVDLISHPVFREEFDRRKRAADLEKERARIAEIQKKKKESFSKNRPLYLKVIAGAVLILLLVVYLSIKF